MTTRFCAVFSHGKDSGPWGAKITAMAEVARQAGANVESVDYQGINDPQERVKTLLALAPGFGAPLILVGSSMGGHVSATAAATLKPVGLFLLAPAFYMRGYESHTPQDVACPSYIVHGWQDDIVPVANSIRWAQEHRATLHVVNSGHRLEDQIPAITRCLRDFLLQLGLGAQSALP